MNVVIQPQTQLQIQSDQWSTGLCDCLDDLPVCCCAFWCFECFACSTSDKFGEFLCLRMVDWLAIGFLQMMGVPACVPPASLAMRVAVRQKYGIQGGICTDCCYATFCNLCSWCQIAREIKRRKKQTVAVFNAQPVALVSQPVAVYNQQATIAPQPGPEDGKVLA